MSEKVQIPKEVYSQLEALRQLGAVNMFTEVKHGLRQMGFDEALEWVNKNPETYTEGFKKGFEPIPEQEG